MKRLILFLTVLLLGLGFSANTALAVPSLQLYIPGGEYDWSDETWKIDVENGDNFTLTALAVDRDLGSGHGDAFLPGDPGYPTRAYLSVALVGAFDGTENPSTFGTITIDGHIYPAGTWVYEIAPVDDPAINPSIASGELAPHGIFPTWYFELAFDFVTGAGVWDTQDTIDPAVSGIGSYNTTGFREDFIIGGLEDLYGIADSAHFDLYTKDAAGHIHNFAPFSHDAESIPVPEPATMLLLGTGLIGIAGIGRKRFKKA